MIRGETLKLSVSCTGATALEFRFGGASAQTVAATASGTVWSISAPTLAWAAGNYRWQAWATGPDGIAVVATDHFQIEEALGVGDSRTSAAKMVEMIEAMMAGNASEGVKSYSINNRTLERYSMAELLQLLSYWRMRLAQENRKTKGLFRGPNIEVRI